jgi:hypothetical protein
MENILRDIVYINNKYKKQGFCYVESHWSILCFIMQINKVTRRWPVSHTCQTPTIWKLSGYDFNQTGFPGTVCPSLVSCHEISHCLSVYSENREQHIFDCGNLSYSLPTSLLILDTLWNYYIIHSSNTKATASTMPFYYMWISKPSPGT